MKRGKKDQQLKKSIIIFFLFVLLAAAMILKDYMEDREELTKGILRGNQGDAPITEAYTAETEDGFQSEIQVEVMPRESSAEESRKLLEQAKELFEETYLGENPSPDDVEADLVLPEEFLDGKVQAEYEIDPPQFLNTDGQIDHEGMPEDGIVVLLKAVFTCGKQTMEYEIPLHLQPKQLTGQEKIRSDIQQEVEKEEADSRQEQRFQLPAQIDGTAITWKKSPDWDGAYFILAGAVASVCVWRQRTEKEKKRKKDREKELMKDYPHMVMQLSMLMGAGMTAFGAWEKMVRGSGKTGKDRTYLKEMQITYREIKDGCPEGQAYEKFGLRIGLLPYRKFASLLFQNLQKGSGNLRYLLEQEADSVMEERKNAAKKQGEEAGTKMLMPMMLMLVIVLIIIVVPAATSF